MVLKAGVKRKTLIEDDLLLKKSSCQKEQNALEKRAG